MAQVLRGAWGDQLLTYSSQQPSEVDGHQAVFRGRGSSLLCSHLSKKGGDVALPKRQEWRLAELGFCSRRFQGCQFLEGGACCQMPGSGAGDSPGGEAFAPRKLKFSPSTRWREVPQPCPFPSCTGSPTPSARVTAHCLWGRHRAARGDQPS